MQLVALDFISVLLEKMGLIKMHAILDQLVFVNKISRPSIIIIPFHFQLCLSHVSVITLKAVIVT